MNGRAFNVVDSWRCGRGTVRDRWAYGEAGHGRGSAVFPGVTICRRGLSLAPEGVLSIASPYPSHVRFRGAVVLGGQRGRDCRQVPAGRRPGQGSCHFYQSR